MKIEKRLDAQICKASAPEYDATFILSSPEVDRVGDTIDPRAYAANVGKRLPALFGHDHKAIFGAWENLRVEGKQLVADLRTASTNLGKMVKALLLDDIPVACSIGFSGSGKATDTGIHFSSIDIHEASIVAVPAAPAAQRIKSLASDHGIELNSDLDPCDGEARQRATECQSMSERHTAASKHAESPAFAGTKPQKGLFKVDIQTKLQAYAAQRSEAEKGIETIKAAALEEDRDLTDDEMETIDNHRDAIEKANTQIAYWKEEESKQASRAKPVETVRKTSEPSIGYNFRKDENPAQIYGKVAAVHAKAALRRADPVLMAKELYPHDDRVEAFVKTAATSARTDQAGWVQELMETASIELIETLKPVSVYGRLSSMGNTAPFNGARTVSYLSRGVVPPANAQHAWVGEGGVIPVIQGSYTSRNIERNKIAGIVTVTKEALRYATVRLEDQLMGFLRDDLAAKLDAALLSSLDHVAGLRSAGLLSATDNGATTAAGSNLGTTKQADIDADLAALKAVFTGANYNGSIALLVNPAQMDALYMTTNASGAYIYRDSANAMMINGMAIIPSTNVAAGTVHAVGATDFVTTFDPAEIEVDDTAALSMANADGTAPTQAMDTGGDIATAGEVGPKLGIHLGDQHAGTANPAATAAAIVSMFQTWQVAIKQVLPVGWGMRRSGLVVSRTAVHW